MHHLSTVIGRFKQEIKRDKTHDALWLVMHDVSRLVGHAKPRV